MFIKRDTAGSRLAGEVGGSHTGRRGVCPHARPVGRRDVGNATVRAAGVLVATATVLAGATAAAAAPAPAAVRASVAGKVTIYSGKALHLAIGFSEHNLIASGPGGDLWFANPGDDGIGRITTLGQATQFTAPQLGLVQGLTAGPDGALWFTNWGPSQGNVGRLGASGGFSWFDPNDNGQQGIVTGPDGNLWYVDWSAIGTNPWTIGRMTTGGVSTLYPSKGIYPGQIAAGSDGALWYTLGGSGNGIGRITTTGTATIYRLSALPGFITAGPDGALWFTLPSSNQIGRISTAGVVTTYTSKGLDDPWDIAAGPDGRLWFTNYNGNTIGRITIQGKITTFPAPGISHPEGIAAGPDGAMWFTNPGNNTIGRITTSVTPQISGSTPTSGAPGTQVIITGHNLQGATAIDFNGVPATILSDTATVVRTTVPAGATSGHITITTAVGTATSKNTFTVT